ncbi:hypothetical protein A1O3_09712 [Capronia epimyces CBS 606.96]|uniref:Ig-like domain-containing protein n=1 Tax=Capronia epimyces CBS 606.96 TaxID=1182542 RepID=W9XKJ2_9EURO|nr:uncharacterized protein A1O3_09712 [Capronia epimyces CBS 606.96]EXJ77486.1 hypothetical protein A1O3_09712 [Capronia epimyces CBS 606.96]
MSSLDHGLLRHPSLLLACLAWLLLKKGSAQLVGCDVLGCQADGCTVGNTTNSFIGTTSFNTSVSPHAPLTWTVGASSQQSSGNSPQTQFVKNFYLGYPPSLDLAGASDFMGCALFFEGIAKSITLNGTSEYTSVTCGQTLGDGCVHDLVSQAQQQVQTLRDASEITGPHATLSPIKQTSCHPSTGGAGYDVALIETQRVTSEEVSSDNAPFFFSLTPVLTVFYNPSGADSKTSGLPEASLSCLKVVEDSSSPSQSATNAAVVPLPGAAHLVATLMFAVSVIAFL